MRYPITKRDEMILNPVVKGGQGREDSQVASESICLAWTAAIVALGLSVCLVLHYLPGIWGWIWRNA